MSCVISIPVHENHDCIINHVNNIKKYVPSCTAVILHVSGDSSNELYNILKNKEDDFIYVNVTRYKSHKSGEAGNVTGLTTIWCDNFRYISRKIKFDHYIMNTSNELFVKKGLEEDIKNFQCQYPVLNPPWNPNQKKILAHGGWTNMWEEPLKKVIDYKWPEMGVCEGSFFHYEVFRACSDIVLDKLCKEGPLEKGTMIGHQEYVIPTIIFNLFPELYTSIIPETFVFGPKDYNPFALSIPKNIVDDVKNSKYPHRHAVKRVPRHLDHPIRRYINNLNDKDTFKGGQ